MTPQTHHQHVVIDPVEELFQVHVHHPTFPFLNVTARHLHGVSGTASGSIPVAVFAEERIEVGLQHLQQRLLDKTVQHRRYPQRADAAAGLFNLDLQDRLRPVFIRPQPAFDLLPMGADIVTQLDLLHAVHYRRTIVGYYPAIGGVEVLTGDYLLHRHHLLQLVSFRVHRFRSTPSPAALADSLRYFRRVRRGVYATD